MMYNSMKHLDYLFTSKTKLMRFFYKYNLPVITSLQMKDQKIKHVPNIKHVM